MLKFFYVVTPAVSQFDCDELSLDDEMIFVI